MKKSLSLVLALLMVFSCLSVLFTAAEITAFAASGENHTVSTSVEAQNGLLGGVITTEANRTVAYDDSITVTAKPYYGNGFLGWYNGTEKVSSELSYTFIVKGDTTLKAKFDIRNLVENGDMEAVSTHQSIIDTYNSNPSYSVANRGTAAIGETDDLSNCADAYGDYALKLTPAASTTAASKKKSLLCIPVTVSKNQDYIWRFSYRFSDTLSTTFNTSNHSIRFALNSAVSDWNNASSAVKWTMNSHPAGTEVGSAAWTNTYAWGGAAAFTAEAIGDNGRVVKGKWQDVYVLFNPGEDEKIFANGDTGTIYLMLGSYHQSCVDTVYVDNISVSEAAANDKTVVSVSGNGSVSMQDYRQGEDYYVYTPYARGNANAYSGRDTSKVYYPTIYERFTAKADTGNVFDGWYDGDTLVSEDLTAPLLMNGKNYTARFLSKVYASDGGYITKNPDGTYTATAFYGNRFLGWYDGDGSNAALVTTEATADTVNTAACYAKFSFDNKIFDGDFESGCSSTVDTYEAYPHYSSIEKMSGYAVIDNPVANSGKEYGNKVLMVTPYSVTDTGKPKNLMNIPVEVEAGKQYIWKFSYTFLALYDSEKHYLTFSVDKHNTDQKPIAWGYSAPYSFHSQLASYEKDRDEDILDNINDFQYAWGKITSGSYSNNKNSSDAGKWVDFYVVFTPESSGKYYLTLGTINAMTDAVVFDNMSFTEVTNGSLKPSISSSGNGKVEASLASDVAFEATAAKGTEKPFESSIDTAKPLYPVMDYTYYATADMGYAFDGWYLDGNKVSSDPVLSVAHNDGGSYTAKFITDPNKYSVSAKVESGSTFGGYISGDKAFNELPSGSKVTVSVIPYYGNVFDGWYDGNALVSDKETFEYTVTKNTELVAKFECNNLILDSGYENTEVAASVVGNGKEWNANDAYGNVVNIAAASGTNSINISAADKDIKHSPITVLAGKTYHLAFNWMISNTGNGYGLEYVKVYDAADDSLIAKMDTFSAQKEANSWQKVYLNFENEDASSIYFVVKYSGAASSIYIDDVVLYDTASAPFIIKAEMDMENIYPGYITGDAVQNVYYGQNATVSVKTYMANKFLGWYKDGVLVSNSESYTFPAAEFTTLTAKFEINNLIADSGYENSPVGESLSDLGLWQVNESNKHLWGFDVWFDSTADGAFTGHKANSGGPFEINAYDGKNVIRATHRNNFMSTTLTGLKENTNYVFTYYWHIQNLSSDAYLAATTLTGIQSGEELGAGRGVGIGAASAEEWQKVTIPFFTGQNTEIKLAIKYQAGSGDFYIDNMALYESDYITLVAGDGGSIDTAFNGGVSGPAQRGESITLKAIPDSGYEFIGWYDYTDSSKIFGLGTTYTFEANGAVAIAAYFKPIGSDEDPINYFVDGDFENNCLIPPTFDHKSSGTDWCTYGVTSAAGNITAYSGDNFLRINAHSRSTNFLISNLEPFTTYTVSLVYNLPEYYKFASVSVFQRRRENERRENATKGETYWVSPARTYSASDRVGPNCLGFAAIEDIDTHDKWVPLEFTFTTKNRTEAYLMFNTSRSAGSGLLSIDDVKITKTSGGYTDSVVDGDFEQNSGLDGWQGSFSTANDGGNTYGVINGGEIKNNINLERYESYTVSFKAKSPSGATLRYGITRGGIDSLYSGDILNAFTGYSHGSAVLENEWKEYSFSISSTDVLQYSLFLSSDGEAMIDDVKLYKANDNIAVHKLSFEAFEGNSIRLSLMQKADATLSRGSKNWQSNNSLNTKFFELYSAQSGDANVHSGQGSLVMRKDPISALTAAEQQNFNDSGHPLTQTFTRFQVRPGKVYELSYWVKADVAGSEYTSMVVQLDSSWYWYDDEQTVTLSDTEWTQIKHYIIADDSVATGSETLYFCVNSLGERTKGDIYFDDIEIIESSSSITNTSTNLLYTHDISQNYIENYSFEKEGGYLGAYSKAADDAVYGEKIGSFSAGDRVIIPVDSRVDYNQEWASEYTLAASLRGDASARGGIYISTDSQGKNRLCAIGTEDVVSLSPNTDGKWKRSGFTFADNRLTTVYLIIECTAGSFDVDYIELFNANHGYETVQYDHTVVTFDPNDESNFVDPEGDSMGNYISGTITGLPSGSKLVLKGKKNYTISIGDDGAYQQTQIQNGTYQLFLSASDCEKLTLWGDITFKDGEYSGLACYRLSGTVTNVSGQGVRNGIAKIVDNDTGWAYLTATNANGEYSAYILDCNWYVEGTTNDAAALKSHKVSIEQFNSGIGAINVEPLTDIAQEATSMIPTVCTIIMLIAAATLVIAHKKGARI